MKQLIIALVFLVVPALAQAQITNGKFETGDFFGWETIGDALVVDTPFGLRAARRGPNQALITNAPSNDGEHPESYSGNNPVDAYSQTFPLTPPSTLELFLGLGSGSLKDLAISLGHNPVPWEGSAIKQTFTANAGSILEFRWKYLTDEGDAFLVDFAFVVLDGNILFLADNASEATHDSKTPFADESGYRIFVMRLATGGTHTIGIGVIDTFDGLVNSAVLVDNFRVIGRAGVF